MTIGPERLTTTGYKATDNNASWLQNRVLYPTVAEHKARYLFAANVIQAQKSDPQLILDAASGAGWGSDHLAQITGAHVVGIDYDPEAVAEAREHYESDHVSFMQGDLLEASSYSGIQPADVIVSFETFEHVTASQAPALLGKFRDAIKDEGTLMISTPNSKLFSPYTEKEGKPWFPYHHKEYRPDEFRDVLEDNGWQVDSMHGQIVVGPRSHALLASALYPVRRYAQHKSYSDGHPAARFPTRVLHRIASLRSDSEVKKWDQSASKKEPVFLLAVCSPKNT